ncbi:MAG: hypothetical protein IIB77_10015, partial [Proteobacteria bacterium]|nr:hypothetical protein [Pseudomonadota bacterium]
MRAQRLSGRFVLVYLLVSLASCDRSVPVVVAGVSLELAQHRARTISEVHYRLRFDIPAVVDADIEGFVAISFVLEGDGSELQLDFRETSGPTSRFFLTYAVIWEDEEETLLTFQVAADQEPFVKTIRGFRRNLYLGLGAVTVFF